MRLGLLTDVDNLSKRIWLIDWIYRNPNTFGPTIWPYALRMIKGRQKYMQQYRAQWQRVRKEKAHWEQIDAVVVDVLGFKHSTNPWSITNTELEQLHDAIALTTAISNTTFEPIYVQQKNLPTFASFTIDNLLNTFVRIY